MGTSITFILKKSVGTYSKFDNYETYSTVSEGNCDRASGIEPVRLLCDRSLQHMVVL
jgi:hypothetical protein